MACAVAILWPWDDTPRPNPTPTLGLRPRWMPLRRGGAYNDKIRERLRGKAGVYAVRERGAGRTVLYVGESHTPSAKTPDRFWRTLIRHLQPGSGAFEKRGEWVYAGRKDLDVSLWVTPPAKAFEHEGRLIAELEPLHTASRTEDDSFDPATF